MNHRIPASQMTAWMLVALSGPLLSVIGQSGWLTNLYTSGLCAVLVLSVFCCGNNRLPAWLNILEMLWLAVVLGNLARQCTACWEEAAETPIIPITLLLLGAFAAVKGAQQSSRIGATLLWLTLPVLAMVFLTGITEIRPQWVETDIEEPNGLTTSLLLVPTLLIYLPVEQKKGKKWSGIWIAVVATVTTWAIEATLGSSVVKQSDNAFYEFSKGVNLFGVAERFEALVACSLTAGWFALFALLFSTVYHWGECTLSWNGKWSVLLCAVASAGVLCMQPVPQQILTLGCLVSWVFAPILAQGIGNIIKWRKMKITLDKS